MANRRADRQAHKRRRIALRRHHTWIYAAILDKEEMRLFFAQKRFDRLIREVKRRLYRRPQNVVRKYARQRQHQTITPLNFDASTIYEDTEFYRSNYECGLDER